MERALRMIRSKASLMLFHTIHKPNIIAPKVGCKISESVGALAVMDHLRFARNLFFIGEPLMLDPIRQLSWFHSVSSFVSGDTMRSVVTDVDTNGDFFEVSQAISLLLRQYAPTGLPHISLPCCPQVVINERIVQVFQYQRVNMS